MSREVRRVRPDWEHPHRINPYIGGDEFRPLFDDYADAAASFEADPDDWDGEAPDPARYMPAWAPEEATAYQVYESVSEGTPISPVLPDREALIEWLVNDGSGLGIGGRKMPLTREQAERFAGSGYAPSMVMVGGYLGSALTAPTNDAEAWTPEEILQIAAQTPGMEIRRG